MREALRVSAKCCFTHRWRETWATAQEPSRERTATRSCVLGTLSPPGTGRAIPALAAGA